MSFDQPSQRDASSGDNNQIVLGVFSHAAGLEAALSELRRAQFSRHQLGVIARADVAEWTAASTTEFAGQDNLWALGIAAGILTPIGPVIAGGLLGSVLASAVAGADTGGLSAGLIGLGLADSEVQIFNQELFTGQMLVVVQAGRRATEAKAILRRHGARDLESTRKMPPPE
jgi:hypothetical protein